MPNHIAKTLILGRIPKGADPKTTLAAGPWCFSGREAEYPNFAQTFTMAKEPLAADEMLAKSVLLAKTLTASLIPKMAKKLAPTSHLPESYWEVLLIPWLGLISEQIIERWLRILALKDSLGSEYLRIPIVDVKKSHFSFASEADLTLNGALGLNFNHWLFSYLLINTTLPSNWVLEEGQAIIQKFPSNDKEAGPKSSDLKKYLKQLVKKFLRKLPVPHLKGLTLGQSLLFSLALAHKSYEIDQSKLLQNLSQNTEELIALKLPDIWPILEMSLPTSIKNLSHPKKLAQTKAPRLRVASVEAYEDAIYRQDLAIFRGQGHRLIFIQHGGNYGQIRYACLTEMFEYTQQAFITWGWSEQAGINGHFIPLPYPQLAKIRHGWKGEKSQTILFVGTEMPLFGYRLDSHPTPLQVVSYREAKVRFLATLPDDLRNCLLYRPYFDVPGCLEDYSFIKQHFPQIKRCVGDLKEHFLNTHLLILDHHGTTLLEAMAANVPVICYWNRDHWPLNSATQDLFDKFKNLGIYHETAEDAARFVSHIWPNLVSFWQSQEVQEARSAFCQKFARIQENNENPLWVATLKKL
ncbi:MAG: hypothetical protein IJT59_06360 [Desulfovibrionaceae bacterium]|nr:hypothetical protein [Desulfovibrionaceae bacterium]